MRYQRSFSIPIATRRAASLTARSIPLAWENLPTVHRDGAPSITAETSSRAACSLTASGETMFCSSTSLSSSSGKRDRKPLPAWGEMEMMRS